MSDLYDEAVLAWSERQADLLRRHATCERLNEQPDWANIIEEIESAGRSQLTAVQSSLVQALLHHLKVKGWPDSAQVPHWRVKARGFRGDAASEFAPSMRQRIDVAKLYRRALDRVSETIDGRPPLSLPVECLFTLDQLLGPERDLSMEEPFKPA